MLIVFIHTALFNKVLNSIFLLIIAVSRIVYNDVVVKILERRASCICKGDNLKENVSITNFGIQQLYIILIIQ